MTEGSPGADAEPGSDAQGRTAGETSGAPPEDVGVVECVEECLPDVPWPPEALIQPLQERIVLERDAPYLENLFQSSALDSFEEEDVPEPDYAELDKLAQAARERIGLPPEDDLSFSQQTATTADDSPTTEERKASRAASPESSASPQRRDEAKRRGARKYRWNPRAGVVGVAAHEYLLRGPLTPRSHQQWAAEMWLQLDPNRIGSLADEEIDCEAFHQIIEAVIMPGQPDPSSKTACPGSQIARARIYSEQALGFCRRKAALNDETDGRLSFEEFSAFALCLRKLSKAKVHHTSAAIFALYDLDGDMRLSESEFKELYRFYMGRYPSLPELAEEWTRLKADPNLGVSYDDYATWLRTARNPIFKQHAPPEHVKLEPFLGMGMPLAPVHGSSHIRKAPPPPLSHASLSPAVKTKSMPNIHAAPAASDWPGWDDPDEAAAKAKLQKEAKHHSRLWKRGGLGIYASSRAASQHQQPVPTCPLPVKQRPKWNNNKYDPAIHLPLEPKRRSFAEETSTSGFSKYKKRTTKDFPLRTPPSQRVYMNKHQSMPQLVEHLERANSPMGRDLLSTLRFSVRSDRSRGQTSTSMFPESLPGLRSKETSQSQSSMHNDGFLHASLSHRHVDGGKMRDHLTGALTPWNNHWNPKPGIMGYYGGGTNTLRAPTSVYDSYCYGLESDYPDCTF